METSPPAPRNLRNNRGEKNKEKDTSLSTKEKVNHGSEEKGVKTVRTTRYKDKFTALRDKYEHVMAQQQGYQQDLETANSKIKKLQEEIDLLLESLMPTTPPAPSATLDRPERDNYHNRPHGMDIDSEPPRESVPIPIQLVPRDHTIHHDNPRSRPQPNGKPNGSTVNGTRPYSVEPESDHNPSYLSREGNGRIPIS